MKKTESATDMMSLWDFDRNYDRSSLRTYVFDASSQDDKMGFQYFGNFSLKFNTMIVRYNPNIICLRRKTDGNMTDDFITLYDVKGVKIENFVSEEVRVFRIFCGDDREYIIFGK